MTAVAAATAGAGVGCETAWDGGFGTSDPGAAPGDWWQFGYTAAHTRYNPNETTINQSNVVTLGTAAQQRPLVAVDIGPGYNAAALAVANGLAYANAWNHEGGGSALLAYDTGAFQAPPVWRQERAGCGGDSPTVHLGIVLVGGSSCRPSAANGAVRAFNATTGQLLWSYTGNEDVGTVSATNGVAYSTGTENGAARLFARAADTGALRWKRALPGQVTGSWLAVAGGRVLASTSAGISTFDAATGTPRWRVTVAGASSPAVANGLVFAGLARGIGAWRLSDGVRRWRYGTIQYGAPVVSGGRLYVPAITVINSNPVGLVDQVALGAAGAWGDQVTGTVSGTPNLRQYSRPASGRERIGS